MKKIFAPLVFLLFFVLLFNNPPYFNSSVATSISNNFPLQPTDDVIVHAFNYLHNIQSDDGSIGGFAVSAWTTMAISAADQDPHNWKNLVDYLRNNIDRIEKDKATDWERHALAIVASNENPRDFGGLNFINKIMNFYDGQQIGNKANLYDDFFGIIALISSGVDREINVIKNIVAHIKEKQYPDGSWGDVDSTAAAIMALIISGEGENSNHIENALLYIKSRQTNDGGFKSWGETNAATTSWSIMAIVASGQNPTDDYWKNNGYSPVDYLLSLQQKNGCFNWSVNQNMNPEWMTSYVIPSLLGEPYPVKIIESEGGDENNGNKNEDEGNDGDDDNNRYSLEEWIGYTRIEGKNETIWSGEVIFNESLITALNKSSGKMEDFFIPYPSVLGALDKASKLGGFNYFVEYYPSWNAFLVISISDDSDWWHYWVDYNLPMVGAGSYILTNEDKEVLWGYLEDWNARALRIMVDKQNVNVSEEFIVTVYNETMVPVKDAVVYVDSEQYLSDENGRVSIIIDKSGDYTLYAEKEDYVRSEKNIVHVKKLLEIVKPKDNSIYILNRKTMIKHSKILIIGHIDIKLQADDNVDRVEFYVNNNYRYTDDDAPFKWRLNDRAFFKKMTIKVIAFTNNNDIGSNIQQMIKYIFSLSENNPAKQVVEKIINYLQSIQDSKLNQSDVDEKEVEIINLFPRIHII